MIEIDSGLLAIIVIVGGIVACVVAYAITEERKNDRWLESMRRMSRRCPACQPWGGWYLGAMRPDGSYETHTCDVCHGTGELDG